MAKSYNAFIKKQKEEARRKKKAEKEERKLERKKSATGGKLEDMLAYVDSMGNPTSAPPPKETQDDTKDKTINNQIK